MRAARAAVQAEERQLARLLAVADDALPRPVAAEGDEALGHYAPGSVTCNVSPSTATEPPSVRTSRTATAAPRSRRSSPRTTGAEAGVIGETSTRRMNRGIESLIPDGRSERPLRGGRVDRHLLALALDAHELRVEPAGRGAHELAE